MSRPALTLRPVDGNEGDLSYVEAVLADNDLPSSDVRANAGRFYVACAGDERIGVGGIEAYGSDGLLRSVAVERPVRGNGYGTAIREELESRARTEGVETLYLLTTTAAEFFADAGYDPVERDEAPPAIRRTTEFADLCPSTATCLRKRL